ncbi:MAG: S53 family peptidase [Methylocystis sp.]
MRTTTIALLAAAVAFGTPSIGFSQTVRRSGNTYHIEACSGPVVAGTARCHAHVVTDPSGKPLEHEGNSEATEAGYRPSDLRAAYNITASGSSSTTIAIVDAYGYADAESNLAVYRSTFGLPACTTANGCFAKYNQNGSKQNYPPQNTGWAQEQALDLDMVSAMCPNCKIILVEANSGSFSDLAAAVKTAAGLGAHVISNSYGGGEAGSSQYEIAYNHAGIAVTVSSGDSGYGVEFPASSPHVTAVGGTSLAKSDSASRGWSETAWSGAGSGCSAVYPQPMWQTPYDTACPQNRMVADVSAVADPNTGVAVYGPVSARSYGWLVFGGTSVSAQIIAGVYGVSNGSVVYGSNPYYGTSSLFNVTSGSDGNCGTYLCNAGPGYNGPTGLGTPDGAGAF